jgi:hypothetical protein
MEIDPPTPEWTFVPTSIYEAQWLRSWGQAFCIDNDLDEVEFDYSTAHQWEKHFKITAHGFMQTDMDLSLEQERVEVQRIHASG